MVLNLLVMIRESLWIHNFYPFDIIIKADARSISHLFILLSPPDSLLYKEGEPSHHAAITSQHPVITRNKTISSFQIRRRGLRRGQTEGAEEDPSPWGGGSGGGSEETRLIVSPASPPAANISLSSLEWGGHPHPLALRTSLAGQSHLMSWRLNWWSEFRNGNQMPPDLCLFILHFSSLCIANVISDNI